jgi:hypothetical protein
MFNLSVMQGSVFGLYSFLAYFLAVLDIIVPRTFFFFFYRQKKNIFESFSLILDTSWCPKFYIFPLLESKVLTKAFTLKCHDLFKKHITISKIVYQEFKT